MNAAETTAMPAIVDSTALREAIGSVLFAVDTEGKREAYAGIRFEAGDGKLCLIATDGRRIAKCSIEAEAQAWDERGKHGFVHGFTLPLQACRNLHKRLKESHGCSVSIQPDDLRENLKGEWHYGIAKITVGLLEESETTLQAKFPNVSRLLAWQIPCCYVVASDLRTAIRHVVSQHPKWNEWHGFECKDGWLRLSRDDGKGGEFSHSLKVRDGIAFGTRVFGCLILRWLELLGSRDEVAVTLDWETKTVQLRSMNRQFVTSLEK